MSKCHEHTVVHFNISVLKLHCELEYRLQVCSSAFKLKNMLSHYVFHIVSCILKQNSLATNSLVGILLIIKISVLKFVFELIAKVCPHVNYPIIVTVD